MKIQNLKKILLPSIVIGLIVIGFVILSKPSQPKNEINYFTTGFDAFGNE